MKTKLLIIFFSIMLLGCGTSEEEKNNAETAALVESSQQIADQLALNYSLNYTVYKNTTTQIILGNNNQTDHFINVEILPSNGVLTGQLTGAQLSASYIANTNYAGVDTISFSVTHKDGGNATGQITITVLNVIDSVLDTDNDGISDVDEVDFYGTSPINADTDADGFTDFQEIVVYGFDAKANNFRFNPLIADIPQISIELASAPDIFLNYTETDGTSSSITTNRTDTSSNTISKSNTNEQSTSFEHSHSAALQLGWEEELKIGTGGADVYSKYSVNLTLTSTIGYGETESNSWTSEQSSENAFALEEGNAFEESKDIQNSGGGVTVNVKIKNTGHISYTLYNLYLNASYFDLSQNNPSIPIGNLVWENQFVSEFPKFTLSPGDSTNEIAYTTSELSISTTKALLANSKGLSIKPTVFDMLDQNGVSYSFNQTGIQAQDTTIIIDFGGVNQSANITKLISTNADQTQTGITIQDALETVLQLDIETDGTDGFITSVNSLANNEPNGYWVIGHAAQSGNDEITSTVYTTPTDQTRVQTENSGVSNLVSNYDISQIRLHGGDLLHLVYMLDDDQDGISNRDEFLYRTDVNNPDTDGDGLTDYAEVTGWKVSYTEVTGSPVNEDVTSDPLSVDSDLDQLSDFVEANINSTDATLKRNPNSKDTDGDGIDDLADDIDANIVDSPSNFLSNAYDKIDLVALTSSVDTPNAFPSNVTFSYSTRDVTEQGVGVSGNGIDEYIVNVYRHVSSPSGTHPEPLSPPIDFSPIVNLGQTLSCGAGCSWELVHLGTDIPGATSDGDTEDGNGVTQQIASGDDHKYIVYLRINGRYFRSTYSTIASATTETVTFQMLSGNLNNVKTIADHLTLLSRAGVNLYSSDEDLVFYQTGTTYGEYLTTFQFNNLTTYGNRIIGNVYDGSSGALLQTGVYYDRCPVVDITDPNNPFNTAKNLSQYCWSNYWVGRGAYDTNNLGYSIIDGVNADDIPPYTHPLGNGDNHFSLNWRLEFQGTDITPRPVPSGANSGPYREICGSMQNRRDDGQLAVDINGLQTLYLNSLYNNNDCTNISAIADDGGDGGPTGTPTGYTLTNGAATFSVDVPAQAGCHSIKLYTYEYDHQVGALNDVFPQKEESYENIDSAELCRSDNSVDSVWTLKHIIDEPQYDNGQVISPVTNASSANNIQYRTRTMQWKDDPSPGSGVRTTMQGDLTIRYDISID